MVPEDRAGSKSCFGPPNKWRNKFGLVLSTDILRHYGYNDDLRSLSKYLQHKYMSECVCWEKYEKVRYQHWCTASHPGWWFPHKINITGRSRNKRQEALRLNRTPGKISHGVTISIRDRRRKILALKEDCHCNQTLFISGRHLQNIEDWFKMWEVSRHTKFQMTRWRIFANHFLFLILRSK